MDKLKALLAEEVFVVKGFSVKAWMLLAAAFILVVLLTSTGSPGDFDITVSGSDS